METSWNLLEVKLDTSNLPDDIIQLTPETSIKFNYPDYSLASKMTAENASEMALEVVINSIDYIYDGKNSYYASELKREELIDFIESLNMEQYQKIENFFNSLPTLKQNLKIKCKKCGFEHDILIEGLESFFG
jgi:hypothetical protein